MALQYDPSVTYNAAGNALTSQSLAASGTVTFTVDFSSNKLGGWVQVWDTTTTVAATNGCTVNIYPAGDTTPAYDTVPWQTWTMSPAGSSVARQSVLLPPGKYQIQLVNLDATNAITVEATSNPLA